MGTSSPTSSPATSVLSGLAAVRGWAADSYRDLHAHPELSHQEHATASKVAERLRASGIEVHAGVGGTGVVGMIRNGDGPTVLLRADMDALPVAEATGLDYASHATATDGGTIRDVEIRRVPTVLSSGLYAIPAACGATLTALALEFRSTFKASRNRAGVLAAWCSVPS